ADVSRRVPGPVAVLLLEAGGWRGESRGADGAGRSRRYRGRGSACLPRVSVDRRGADRRTAAGHHQGSHALLRAARDAATREGAEVGCQSDPGGGSRIARLLPAVGLLCVLALPGAAEAGKRPPRWLVNGVCGISGGLAFTEIVATERC